MSNQGDSKEQDSGIDKSDSGGARTRSRSRSWDRDRDRDRSQRFGKNFTNSNDPHMKRARLFVGDLNTRTGDLRKRDMETLFSRYGRVCGISIHSGYAFVQMDRERSANKAIHYAHGRLVNGNKIRVEFSSAALEAGAKFRPLSPSEREDFEGSTYGGRSGGSGGGGGGGGSSDLYDTFRRDPLALLEIERMERERLERLLRIERELHARGRDEMDKLYDPLGSASRSKYGSSVDSWRDLDYGRPRRDYSPPTYGSSSRHGQDTSPYHYGMRDKSSPSRYGGYSDSSGSNYPPVGYHPGDKSVSGRDSYPNTYPNTYGSGTGYSGHVAGRSQMSTGYGRDTRNASSAWGNGSNQTYGLMGDSPGWK